MLCEVGRVAMICKGDINGFPANVTKQGLVERSTYSSRKFCCGPITEPGLQILIQAIHSAAVNL